jgi:hypothetical protein
MTTKIVAKYIDRGFGFPIVLEQVPMVQVRGKWTPAINCANSRDSMAVSRGIRCGLFGSTAR